MGTSAELIGLLHQIRNATSPLHRMKLAALAWRTLRGLSPVDRLAVARAIGVEGAERLVEQLGDRSGVSPSLLLSAIQSAEEAEPEELERLLAQLSDPATRDDAVREAVGDAAGWIEEALVAETADDEPAARTDDHGESTPHPTAAEVPSPPPPAPPAAAVAAAPGPAAGVAAPARPPRPAVSRSAPPSAPRPVPVPTPRPSPRPTPDDGRAAARRPSTRTMETRTGILAELESTPSLFRRLRRLTGRASELAGLGDGETAAIAAAFPAGWARRRAIEALIRHGAVTGPEQLERLLGPGADETTRMWLLTALAGRSGLAPESLEAAVADAGPMLRRRLAARTRRRR